jgi:hypothetical protein
MENYNIGVIIGIAIWVIIFVVWYIRTYPAKLGGMNPFAGTKIKWQRKKTASVKAPRAAASNNFKSLVETVESICVLDKFGSSDAATLVDATKELMELEPSSGQIWEAYALDSLESAEITCDHCGVVLNKTVKKTGVRISCAKCGKWLALKNSKVTVIDPSRADLEDWEK